MSDARGAGAPSRIPTLGATGAATETPAHAGEPAPPSTNPVARPLRHGPRVQGQPIVQSVPIKLYRTTDVVSVAAPMPGLEAENVVVDVTADGRLVLCGQLRTALKDVKELLVDEWGAGPYYREIDLPAPVDGERATATYGNGVLVVALPVAPRTRPARLRLEDIGPGRGERVPAEVATTHCHRARRPRTR